MWNPSELEAAAWCGLAAAAGTLARRGIFLSEKVRRLAGWRQWRHGLSGCCSAALVAAGVSLLASDYATPIQQLGAVLVISVSWDLTTAEGLAFVASLVMPRIIAAAERAKADDERKARAKGNGQP